MAHLIDSLDEAIENIRRYQIDAPRLAKRMRLVRAWYAVESDDRTWLFGPSKFIGYAGVNAERYLDKNVPMDGRSTESVLDRWFDVALPDTRRGAEAGEALRRFLKTHGHPGPNKRARISLPKSIFDSGADAVGPEVQGRIRIDPAVCGGRPHIRGTRVRVSDILDLLASGVAASDILADYPYLSEADLRAALAYGAAASAHRVILAV